MAKSKAQPLLSTAVSGDAADAGRMTALAGRSVVLVGMMGAGKSTIGRRLASRLHLPFVDADHEIEQAAAMSVSDLFTVHGEPAFRDGEARVIARLLEARQCVLATGGGAFLREETRARIAARGISLWLKAEPDLIMARVQRRATRPLLQTPDPAGTVRRLCVERDPVYALADITVESRDVTHDMMVEDCVRALDAWLAAAPPWSASDPPAEEGQES